MGFFSSLKGQLGRDTGRFISNKIFGGKHAIRFQNVSTAQNLLKDISEEIEGLKTKINNSEKKYFRKKATKIAEMKVPKQKNELIDMLNFLLAETFSNSWNEGGDDETDSSKYTNLYLDVVLKKYEQCLFFLITNFPKATKEIHMYEKQYKRIKRKRFLQKYGIFLLVGIVFFTVMTIMSIMSIIEKNR